MTIRRPVLWAWLAAGSALLLHDIMTGGGIGGYLLYRELVAYHAMEPILTYLGEAILLVGIPGFILLPPRRFRGPPAVTTPSELRAYRTGGISIAIILGAVSVYALTRSQAIPTSQAPIERVSLDSLGADIHVPPGVRIVLRGVPQDDQDVSYDEVSHGKHGPAHHHPHDYVPLTETHWVKGQPVRVIGDLTGQTSLESAGFLHRIEADDAPGLDGEQATPETEPGLLIAGAPGYLRLAFAAKGVTLAPKVWVYVADIDTVRKDWEATGFVAGLFAAFAAVIAVVATVSGVLARR